MTILYKMRAIQNYNDLKEKIHNRIVIGYYIGRF